FYAVILACAVFYSLFSLNLSWGEDTEGFLFGNYLQLADTPGTFGGLVPGVVIPLAIIWIIVLGILYKGVKKGIEIANRIMIPLLLIIFLIIVIRAVTLPGALAGLDEFFKIELTHII